MGVGNERISFLVLPATKAICIYHKGAYDRLGEAYASISTATPWKTATK